jgi:uncharacterized damage-inducible protein DinB
VLSLDDVAKMSTEEKLARLAEGPDRIGVAVEGQPEPVLVRRPDAKNWAPKEVVCHLRDAEELFTARFQLVAAMDEPRLLPADPDRWAEERQYLRNDAAEALRAFRRRREESLALIRSFTAEQWQRGGIHPTRGRMTVGDFVSLMVWHDENHLEQLQRALRGEP